MSDSIAMPGQRPLRVEADVSTAVRAQGQPMYAADTIRQS